MFCEHKRLKSVNCVLYCADCGARLNTVEDSTIMGETREVVVGVEDEAREPERVDTSAQADAERVTSASGRKIGFETEKKTAPKRRKKGGNET